LNAGWSQPSSSNYVLYTNLLPGNYTFTVRAKTNASVWSNPVSFSFRIKPPFWNTWWFQLLMLIAAAFIIIYLYRNQIKKIRQKASIRHKLTELEMIALKAQMNPHFIYNALNSIQALVASDKKDDAIFYIGTFSRLLRQVLEQSENNVISLQKELQTLELYISLETLRLNMKPVYEVQVDKSIDAASERIPPLILQPFVENSLWHGLSKKEGDKKINIHITAQGEWLTCTIKDNGIGREKAAAAKTLSAQQHQSKATEITIKRLIDFNQDTELLPVSFKDLIDNNGTATGTEVVIHIKRES
jgi:LytS/YehU family sensor histidine kinase